MLFFYGGESMGYKVFEAGKTLTASQVNNYLMKQTIPRFEDDTERDAELTSPEENQLSFLESDNKIYKYDGDNWSVYLSTKEEFDAHKVEDVTDGNTPHGMIYEEGTWTPEISGSSVAGNHSYTIQGGFYIRCNNMIHVEGEVRINTKDTDMSGVARISNIPFTTAHEGALSIGYFRNIAYTQGTQFLLTLPASSSVIEMNENRDNGIVFNVPSSSIIDGSGVRFSGTYQI